MNNNKTNKQIIIFIIGNGAFLETIKSNKEKEYIVGPELFKNKLQNIMGNKKFIDNYIKKIESYSKINNKIKECISEFKKNILSFEYLESQTQCLTKDFSLKNDNDFQKLIYDIFEKKIKLDLEKVFNINKNISNKIFNNFSEFLMQQRWDEEFNNKIIKKNIDIILLLNFALEYSSLIIEIFLVKDYDLEKNLDLNNFTKEKLFKYLKNEDESKKYFYTTNYTEIKEIDISLYIHGNLKKDPIFGYSYSTKIFIYYLIKVKKWIKDYGFNENNIDATKFFTEDLKYRFPETLFLKEINKHLQESDIKIYLFGLSIKNDTYFIEYILLENQNSKNKKIKKIIYIAKTDDDKNNFKEFKKYFNLSISNAKNEKEIKFSIILYKK